MKHEIDVAVDFLMRMVRLNGNSNQLAPGQMATLKQKLYDILRTHYENHWHPLTPERGSAYRCIRINGILDPLVRRAGEASGLSYSLLRSLFPPELTLWVDPQEVAYRFGENGSVSNLILPHGPEGHMFYADEASSRASGGDRGQSSEKNQQR